MTCRLPNLMHAPFSADDPADPTAHTCTGINSHSRCLVDKHALDLEVFERAYVRIGEHGLLQESIIECAALTLHNQCTCECQIPKTSFQLYIPLCGPSTRMQLTNRPRAEGPGPKSRFTQALLAMIAMKVRCGTCDSQTFIPR